MKQIEKVVEVNSVEDTLKIFEAYLKNARDSVKRIKDNAELKSHWKGKVDAYQKVVLQLQEAIRPKKYQHKLGNGGTLDLRYIGHGGFCGYCGKTGVEKYDKCPKCGVDFID